MKHVVRSLVLPLALAAAVVAVGLYPAAGQDKKTKDAKEAKAAKAVATATFELYKDSGGKYRFRLKDDEGTELAMSPRGYETKAECEKVIDAIRGAAAKATLDDQSK
jgi:uncharacterized protein YegP (UPF0339 family)